MELLELFDINEKKLRKKIVRGFEPMSGEYIMVIYLFIHDSKGKILLRRNASTDKWGIPSIFVKHNQPIKSVQKDFYEELGLIIKDDELIPIKTLTYNKYLYKMIYLDKNVNTSDIKIPLAQTRKYKYFSITEIDYLIRNYLFKEKHVMLLEYLKKYLQ